MSNTKTLSGNIGDLPDLPENPETYPNNPGETGEPSEAFDSFWAQGGPVRKFREQAGNKVQYLLPGHSSANSRTITATSVLPVPRKGNPGTLKTTVNVHLGVTLDAGKLTERVVPVVAKLETSFPMGTTPQDQETAISYLHGATDILNDAIAKDLFCIGILPQQ